MTSLPTTLSVGSFSSGHSFRDAIASYRRAQYFIAGSQVTAASDAETFSDEEGVVDNSVDEEIGDLGIEDTSRADQDLDQFSWEAEDGSLDRSANNQLPNTQWPKERRFQPCNKRKTVKETTPLLRKAVSFTFLPRPRQYMSADMGNEALEHSEGDSQTRPRRRLSQSSARALFNAIAILLGVGMLSEPLAFAYSGWMTGTALLIGYGFISCYTAKILAHAIFADPRLRSYSDIGRKAFGQSSMFFISLIFCFELFSVSVLLVTLSADSLHVLLPDHSTVTYKLWSLALLIPTIFLPLSLLSYTSILGVLSSIFMIFVIFVDGFSKPDAPGSLWSPAETNFNVQNSTALGLAFGLFMAGFAGHSVIPSLAMDMVDPSQFDKMINWAFFVATMLYTCIGCAGYLMFGKNVSEEFSMDLMRTLGYSPILNKLLLWMLVISPLSKFALTTQPLNATIEILLGLDTPLLTPEDMTSKSNGLTIAPRGSQVALKRIYATLQRITLTVLSVVVSILVPDFGATMAFLGSFAAFLLCLIGPLSAKIALSGRCSLFDGMVLFVGVIMAIWGTGAAFLTA